MTIFNLSAYILISNVECREPYIESFYLYLFERLPFRFKNVHQF